MSYGSTTYQPSVTSWIFLFLLFSVFQQAGLSEPAKGSSNPISGSKQSIPRALSDSISHHIKYGDDLSSLADYLESEGLNIGNLLEDPRFEIYEKIGDRFRNAAEVKSLDITEYKEILHFETKKKRMIQFMVAHAEQLQRAEETYGIPGYVISAIIGIESNFGDNFGRYNPFNSYVSMYAVGYRKRFARAQLKELLIFTRKHNLDVFDLKSSYAGAISFAQFIPYSLNKWFVGDDIFDINNNIQSIANYLAYFKKRTGSIEKAVLRYNPSDLYTRAVLDLAEATEEHFSVSR